MTHKELHKPLNSGAGRCLVDTNFFLIPYQFRVDIVSGIKALGFEPVALSCIISELEKLASNRSSKGRAAKVALEIIEKNRIRAESAESPADEALLDYAGKHGCAVATNDARLIEKLKKSRIRVVRIRQKKLVVAD